MLRKVLLRAGLAMLALSSLAACVTALALWSHSRLVGSCRTVTVLNGDPVTCFYRVEWMPDWPTAAVVFAAGASFCLLASWVSFHLRKTGKAD
ncbi:hypothetical protein ACI6Q5_15545 [Xanthomonas codiaei]|uniref:Uncharacterized protein n=1 Tax=Xanthomonas codiaei TaxID=56463 RepID=A0A2S7CBG2_9XANT|nr:hypothetical protein [Xanthomonas codiaei]PPU58850.1 hypothetical protein XcodCFBP4690_19535 [Xanthomonas codiaei]